MFDSRSERTRNNQVTQQPIQPLNYQPRPVQPRSDQTIRVFPTPSPNVPPQLRYTPHLNPAPQQIPNTVHFTEPRFLVPRSTFLPRRPNDLPPGMPDIQPLNSFEQWLDRKILRTENSTSNTRRKSQQISSFSGTGLSE